MKRRKYELYAMPPRHDRAAAGELIRLKCPNIKEELEFIEKHLGATEHIVISHWTDAMFYIEVRDNRPGPGSIDRMRMALTVNVIEDKIFWSNDTSIPQFTNGGNCFVRSPRWKGLMKKRFNLETEDHFLAKFYSYSSRDFFAALKFQLTSKS